MKAIVQRVKYASLTVAGELIASIQKGLVVFLGVGKGDQMEDIEIMVRKISKLRIFEDDQGKMNLSLADVSGDLLCVSQFTLFADCKQGNRPAFFEAEIPEVANAKYEKVCNMLQEQGISVQKGVFGADMKILQMNDGPVTIILDSKELLKKA